MIKWNETLVMRFRLYVLFTFTLCHTICSISVFNYFTAFFCLLYFGSSFNIIHVSFKNVFHWFSVYIQASTQIDLREEKKKDLFHHKQKTLASSQCGRYHKWWQHLHGYVDKIKSRLRTKDHRVRKDHKNTHTHTRKRNTKNLFEMTKIYVQRMHETFYRRCDIAVFKCT